MAQLRDVQTSELLATGAPADLLLIADKIGPERVMWDDVGWDHRRGCPAINVDAVRSAGEEQLKALTAAGLRAEEKRRAGLASEACRAVETVIASAHDPDADTLPPVEL